jgi:FlgD Ig-like domain
LYILKRSIKMAFGTFTSKLQSRHIVKNMFWVVAISLFLIPQFLLAQISWDGGGADNNWSTALNWVGDVVPGSVDDVVIGDGFTTIIDAGFAGTVNVLTVGGGVSGSVSLSRSLTTNSNLNVSAGASLDLNGQDLLCNGTMTITGTTLFGESINHAMGALTISGTANFESSTVSVNNTLTVNSAATFTPGTSTILIEDGGTGIITSAINISFNNLSLNTSTFGGNGLSFDEVGNVNPVYTINGTFAIKNHGSANTPVSVLNGSVLQYNQSTSTLSYEKYTFNVGDEWPTSAGPANVSVASGVDRTLTKTVATVPGGVTVTGTFTLADNIDLTVSGLITVNGGTFNANATTNPNIVNANGGATISSGTMDVTNGAFNIADGTTLTLSGGTLDVTSGTLDILGGATFSKGTGTLTLGTLTYGATATLNYRSTVTATGEWLTTVPNVSINSGVTTTVSSGSARTISNNLTLNGTGNLTYSLANLLTVSGNFVIGSGTMSVSDVSGTLSVGGTSTIGAGSTVSSGGGTITLVGDVSMDHLSSISTSGTASLEGSLTISGDATVGQAAAGTLEMGGTSATTVNVDGSLTVFDFTVNKGAGASTLVTPSSSVQFKFNTNATLYVQQGILQMTPSSQLLNTSDVNISAGDNVTLKVDATGTFRTADVDITGFNAFTLADNSTIEFTGTAAQDIPAATYGDITVSTTHANGATLVGALVLQTNSDVTVSTSSRLNLGGQTITNSGLSDALSVASGASLYTDGSSLDGFATNTMSGTVYFNGSSQETSPSTVFAANNVVVDNGAGLVIGTGDMTVTGTLTFTNGTITSSASDLLTLGVSATATPTSTSFVTGPVSRQANGAATSFAFPVGNGNNLRSVTLSSVSPAPAGTETIIVEAKGTATGATSSDVDVKSVEDDGYWTVTPSGGVSGATTYTGNFTTAGFSPSITVSSNVTMVKGTTPNFDTQGTSQSSGTDFVQANFTGFSDFAVGNLAVTYTWDGSTDTNWSVAANWDQNAEPGDGDVIVIPTGFTVIYDASVTASNYSSVTIEGSSTLSLDATVFDFSGTTFTLGSTGTLTFNGATINNYSAANTTFPSGSTVQFNTGTVQADTYHHLIISTTGTLSSSGTVTVNGNFTKSGSGTYTASGALDIAGTTTLNAGIVDPSVGATLAGDISGGGGSFSSSSGTVTLDGSGSAQTISGTAISFNNLTLSNTSGLSLSQSPTVEGVFTFGVDALVTTGSNHLLIGQAGSISGASSARYVSGRLAREYPTGSTTFVYPTGKGGEYLPLTLNFGSLTAGYTRVVEQINSDANGVDADVDAGLSKVSIVRYWEVSRVGTGGGISGSITMTLNYNGSDGVNNDATELDVAQLSTDVNGAAAAIGVWQSIGGNGSGTGVGSITSTSFTSGGDFYTFGDAAGGTENSLPVELTSFEAIAEMDKVTLKWVTESETENFGFNIFKKLDSEDAWVQVNDELIAGQGNTSTATGYEFVDFSVRSGDVYSYRLESVSIGGIINVEKVIEIVVPVPDKFVLFNNYPNPFNPVTNLKFQLPEQSRVSMVVYDITGKVVKNLIKDASYDVGQHVVVWDATNQSGTQVSSGLYLYRFTAGKYSKLGRMILLK